MPDDVSADFVFGTLATDELRLAQLRAASAGMHHGHDLVPLDPRPDEPVVVTVQLGPQIDAERVTCYYTTDGRDPAGSRGRASAGAAVALERVDVAWDTLSWTYRETWSGTIPGQADGTLVRYRLEAWSPRHDTTWWASEIAGVVAGERPPGVSDLEARPFAFADPPLWPVRRSGSYAYHVDDERVPSWLRDAVIYQVFVDRFATTGDRPFASPPALDGFFGGTLRGVTERLDHIASLGTTVVWLSPVFPSPSHHGYDATDLRTIEPRLGTEDDLRELLAAAHERGLRVILDLAVNHVSSEHPAFRAARADRDAPEASWFTFTRWPDEYLSFFGVRDHPQIDTDDPGARGYLIESARRWLARGVDGFRCDYAHGPSHAFWSVFRAAIRAAAPDSIALGEVVETPALQRTYRGRLDGCLDFVLLQALRETFAFGTMTRSAFETFVRRHLAYLGDEVVAPSFLDNHDMNRFLWIVQGDVRRLRLAALCQFTLPHPPIVYYGTEVGLSQLRDVRRADGSGHPEEARLPMPWGDDQDVALLAFYRELGALRGATTRVWREPRETLVADDATGLSVIACGSGGERMVVALNNGPNALRFVPEARTGARLALATDPAIRFDAGILTLTPYGGAVLATDVAPDDAPPADGGIVDRS